MEVLYLPLNCFSTLPLGKASSLKRSPNTIRLLFLKKASLSFSRPQPFKPSGNHKAEQEVIPAENTPSYRHVSKINEYSCLNHCLRMFVTQ